MSLQHQETDKCKQHVPRKLSWQARNILVRFDCIPKLGREHGMTIPAQKQEREGDGTLPIPHPEGYSACCSLRQALTSRSRISRSLRGGKSNPLHWVQWPYSARSRSLISTEGCLWPGLIFFVWDMTVSPPAQTNPVKILHMTHGLCHLSSVFRGVGSRICA